MTRLAVLSDIHANLPALEAVAADMAQFSVDQVVVAGDLVNWGPFNREVMDFVTARRWSMIRGNNELYLLDYLTPRAPEYWKEFTLPPWLREQLKDWIHYIGGMPDELQLRFHDAPMIRVLHGYPGNPWRGIFPDTPDEQARELMAGVGEATVIMAHTHIVMDRVVDDWHLLNSGSVGAPLDGDAAAKYMILDGDAAGWKATQRRVEYDYAPVYAEFERQRFIDQVGVTGQLIIEEFKTSRLRVQPCQIWCKEMYPGETLTVERMQEFLSSVDPNRYMLPVYREQRSNDG
ncbi:MAG: metallophosphoesterase family protein [Anaerolineae bacterium]|nr:metallophosphoesterase family protein [Anaerolineae bacterium]